MILYGGEVFETKEQDRLISELDERINRTLLQKKLSPKTVINAAEKLRQVIIDGEFDERLFSLGLNNTEHYKALICAVLSRDSLEQRLIEELGGYPKEHVSNPPDSILPQLKEVLIKSGMQTAQADFSSDCMKTTQEYLMYFKEFSCNMTENMRAKCVPRFIQRFLNISVQPLGVLLHIAAGNMDGLPAMSLAEGLLTGNINILKLPSADNGFSLEIISRLIKYEPELADFVYIFDTPSSDIHAMGRLAALADGIAVWGGETAVKATRAFAPVGTKLIEWGHKLGFCYISGNEDITEELYGLAEHIATTKQLLCSSCQTIFIDTEDEKELRKFCERFLSLLNEAVSNHSDNSIGIRARRTILSRTEQLEEIIGAANTAPNEYKGKGCRLIIKDGGLELSPMLCSVLVKKLPRKDIVSVLRRSKGFLQTAGLICPENERAELSDILCRSGITRITRPKDMSAYFYGEAHDGEYPLRRYTRIVDREL